MSKIVPKDITFKNVSEYDNHILVGIDISKETFHASFLRKNEYFTDCFKQDISDYNALLKKVGASKKILAIMEYSGGYEYQLAEFLYENNHAVHIVNGRVFKRLCQTLNIHGKTDKTDPTVLCEYLAMRLQRLKKVAKTDITALKRISLFFPANDNVKQLKAKKKLRDKINDAVGYYGKMKNSYPYRYEMIRETEKDVKKILSLIEKDLAKMVNQFDCFYYLQTVPGIDVLMAADLIIITNNFQKIKNANECRALFGLAPIERSSGTSVNPNAKKHLVHKAYTYGKQRSLLIITARLLSGKIEYLMKLKRQYEAKGHKGTAVNVKIADKILTAAFICAKKKITFDEYTKYKHQFQNKPNLLPQTQKPMNVLKTRAQEVANDTQFDWFFNPFYQDENLKYLDMEHLSLDKIDIKKVFKFIYFYSAANISHEYEKISKLFDIRNSQCVCPFYEAKIGKATYNQSEYQHEPIINKVVIFYTEINNYESLEFCVEFLRCSYGLSNPIFIKPEYVENCQANEIKAFFTVPTAKFDKNENVIMPLIPTDFFLSQTSHYLNTQKNAD